MFASVCAWLLVGACTRVQFVSVVKALVLY